MVIRNWLKIGQNIKLKQTETDKDVLHTLELMAE